MPGMAANPSIFERINLPVDQFKINWLSWKIPQKDESLSAYSKRMVEGIDKNEPIVLIGVSFGGVLVQEMSRFVRVKRLIIISSVKTRHEIPKRMKIARDTGVYKVLPTGLLDYITHIEKLPVGDLIRKRLKLYQQYLSINDKEYLDWAIKEMLCWEQDIPLSDIIHIHGDEDAVFPIKNISECISIKGGTHIMVLNKFRWFNKNLPELITTGKLKA
ncbi:alpha/beta hydrolase [Psychroflexus montanilacus]|uniref:alpha/beta hydrolase n=1 Tax=Psychroflexus montanilacus TaxID=2873598 RepID=UPI001CCB356E|nr:alpha/beta hydrolase [Psychroflexus montanilacus]MBZ9650568.1 alpha/beta hydrolase [Psychroflexus montanilacus]